MINKGVLLSVRADPYINICKKRNFKVQESAQEYSGSIISNNIEDFPHGTDLNEKPTI